MRKGSEDPVPLDLESPLMELGISNDGPDYPQSTRGTRYTTLLLSLPMVELMPHL